MALLPSPFGMKLSYEAKLFSSIEVEPIVITFEIRGLAMN
jgi:hypothetical protein